MSGALSRQTVSAIAEFLLERGGSVPAKTVGSRFCVKLSELEAAAGGSPWFLSGLDEGSGDHWLSIADPLAAEQVHAIVQFLCEQGGSAQADLVGGRCNVALQQIEATRWAPWVLSEAAESQGKRRVLTLKRGSPVGKSESRSLTSQQVERIAEFLRSRSGHARVNAICGRFRVELAQLEEATEVPWMISKARANAIGVPTDRWMYLKPISRQQINEIVEYLRVQDGCVKVKTVSDRFQVSLAQLRTKEGPWVLGDDDRWLTLVPRASMTQKRVSTIVGFLRERGSKVNVKSVCNRFHVSLTQLERTDSAWLVSDLDESGERWLTLAEEQSEGGKRWCACAPCPRGVRSRASEPEPANAVAEADSEASQALIEPSCGSEQVGKARTGIQSDRLQPEADETPPEIKEPYSDDLHPFASPEPSEARSGVEESKTGALWPPSDGRPVEHAPGAAHAVERGAAADMWSTSHGVADQMSTVEVSTAEPEANYVTPAAIYARTTPSKSASMEQDRVSIEGSAIQATTHDELVNSVRSIMTSSRSSTAAWRRFIVRRPSHRFRTCMACTELKCWCDARDPRWCTSESLREFLSQHSPGSLSAEDVQAISERLRSQNGSCSIDFISSYFVVDLTQLQFPGAPWVVSEPDEKGRRTISLVSTSCTAGSGVGAVDGPGIVEPLDAASRGDGSGRICSQQGSRNDEEATGSASDRLCTPSAQKVVPALPEDRAPPLEHDTYSTERQDGAVVEALEIERAAPGPGAAGHAQQSQQEWQMRAAQVTALDSSAEVVSAAGAVPGAPESVGSQSAPTSASHESGGQGSSTSVTLVRRSISEDLGITWAPHPEQGLEVMDLSWQGAAFRHNMQVMVAKPHKRILPGHCIFAVNGATKLGRIVNELASCTFLQLELTHPPAGQIALASVSDAAEAFESAVGANESRCLTLDGLCELYWRRPEVKATINTFFGPRVFCSGYLPDLCFHEDHSGEWSVTIPAGTRPTLGSQEESAAPLLGQGEPGPATSSSTSQADCLPWESPIDVEALESGASWSSAGGAKGSATQSRRQEAECDPATTLTDTAASRAVSQPVSPLLRAGAESEFRPKVRELHNAILTPPAAPNAPEVVHGLAEAPMPRSDCETLGGSAVAGGALPEPAAGTDSAAIAVILQPELDLPPHPGSALHSDQERCGDDIGGGEPQGGLLLSTPERSPQGDRRPARGPRGGRKHKKGSAGASLTRSQSTSEIAGDVEAQCPEACKNRSAGSGDLSSSCSAARRIGSHGPAAEDPLARSDPWSAGSARGAREKGSEAAPEPVGGEGAARAPRPAAAAAKEDSSSTCGAWVRLSSGVKAESASVPAKPAAGRGHDDRLRRAACEKSYQQGLAAGKKLLNKDLAGQQEEAIDHRPFHATLNWCAQVCEPGGVHEGAMPADLAIELKEINTEKANRRRAELLRADHCADVEGLAKKSQAADSSASPSAGAGMEDSAFRASDRACPRDETVDHGPFHTALSWCADVCQPGSRHEGAVPADLAARLKEVNTDKAKRRRAERASLAEAIESEPSVPPAAQATADDQSPFDQSDTNANGAGGVSEGGGSADDVRSLHERFDWTSQALRQPGSGLAGLLPEAARSRALKAYTSKGDEARARLQQAEQVSEKAHSKTLKCDEEASDLLETFEHLQKGKTGNDVNLQSAKGSQLRPAAPPFVPASTSAVGLDLQYHQPSDPPRALRWVVQQCRHAVALLQRVPLGTYIPYAVVQVIRPMEKLSERVGPFYKYWKAGMAVWHEKLKQFARGLIARPRLHESQHVGTLLGFVDEATSALQDWSHWCEEATTDHMAKAFGSVEEYQGNDSPGPGDLDAASPCEEDREEISTPDDLSALHPSEGDREEIPCPNELGEYVSQPAQPSCIPGLVLVPPPDRVEERLVWDDGLAEMERVPEEVPAARPRKPRNQVRSKGRRSNSQHDEEVQDEEQVGEERRRRHIEPPVEEMLGRENPVERRASSQRDEEVQCEEQVQIGDEKRRRHIELLVEEMFGRESPAERWADLLAVHTENVARKTQVAEVGFQKPFSPALAISFPGTCSTGDSSSSSSSSSSSCDASMPETVPADSSLATYSHVQPPEAEEQPEVPIAIVLHKGDRTKNVVAMPFHTAGDIALEYGGEASWELQLPGSGVSVFSGCSLGSLLAQSGSAGTEREPLRLELVEDDF